MVDMSKEKIIELAKKIVARPNFGCEKLTERQAQVLVLVANGYKTFVISEMFGITERTADWHRGKILKKLRAKTTAHAVMRAFNIGILQPGDIE